VSGVRPRHKVCTHVPLQVGPSSWVRRGWDNPEPVGYRPIRWRPNVLTSSNLSLFASVRSGAAESDMPR